MRKYKKQQSRPSLPHPFRPPATVHALRIVNDNDNDTVRTHSPIPTFSVADPSSLFPRASMLEPQSSSSSLPSSSPGSKKRFSDKMGTLGRRVVSEVLNGGSPLKKGEIVPVSLVTCEAAEGRLTAKPHHSPTDAAALPVPRSFNNPRCPMPTSAFKALPLIQLCRRSQSRSTLQ